MEQKALEAMRSRHNRFFIKIKFKNGFSLIELLIVTFIIMIIAAVASVLYLNTIRSQEDILSKAKSQKDARTALYLMEKEIRESGLWQVQGLYKNKFTNNEYLDFKNMLNKKMSV